MVLKKNSLLDDLNELDSIEECKQLTDKEKYKKEQVFGILEKDTLMKEIRWRQTSRALQLRDGDKNANFFHRLANSHS